MADKKPHTLDDVLEELERVSIRTSQGNFVKTEDARRLVEDLREQRREEEARPKPKTMREANRLAKADPELKERFPRPGPREPGRSVPAGPVRTEPQPSSRT